MQLLLSWTCVFLKGRIKKKSDKKRYLRVYRVKTENESVKGLPGDGFSDNERGTGADPEHPSVELLPQISGFPTTLV